MTDLTNVPVRNINDLELAENIPLDASVLDAVKIPVGGLTQFTQGEALSLKQLREVLVAAMPGWVPSTIDDLIERSDAEVQKMLEKYLNAIKDVSVVLDAIQGQINESHLALELNRKIDIGTLANEAAARAQETANVAYVAAVAAADEARAEGQAAIAYAETRVSEAEAAIVQAKDSAQEAKDAAQNALSYAEAEVLKAKNLAQQALDQANGVLTVTQEGINEAKTLAQQAVDQANDVLDVTIEEINAAKQEAQQLTEQARQAAQALVTALDEKFTALNNNINTEISNLNVGLTQETTARQEGLAQITTTLNAYKAVVDDNLAVLFSKNETIVSDAAALATQVNALKSQVALVEGALPLKLDASAIQNYYTKAQSEANATTVAAGEITKYDSQLVIGGVNQLLDSEGERSSTATTRREYLLYEKSTHLKEFYDNHLNKDVTVSFDLKVDVAGYIQVYSSNGSAHHFVASIDVAAEDVGVWKRYSVTVQPKPHTASTTVSTLEFYGTYDSGRIPHVRKVQLEAGNKATDWSPSPRDVQASLDANATAIQNTNTEVSRVNDAVVSQGQSLTTLQNNLNITNGEVAKKADATVVDGVTSRVTATESGLTSVGNRTTALENSVNHATTGLATKASTSALNTTNSNVSAIDGTVKGHTTQLSNLATSIQTINGTLSNKLDASLINNYYTKGQTDAKAAEIAAGKVEEFNAKLVIGGANLYAGPNPIPMVSQTGEGEYKATSASVNFVQLHKYLESTWLDLQEINTGDPLITSIEVMVPSGSVVGEHSIRLSTYRFGGTSYLNGEWLYLKDFPVDKWVRIVSPPGKFVGASVSSPSSINVSLYLSSRDIGTHFKWRNLMMEKATKASEYKDSDKVVQSKIDANSTAIQNTNAEVTRVDGVATAANNATTALAGRVSTVEGAVATKAEAAALTTLTTRVTSAEGVNTSQGSAITNLQNTINHSTTGLAAKASTSALNLTNSEVTRIDGVVSGHTNQLTQLTSDITAINGTLATKADASALNNIYTKTQTDAKATEIAAGEISKYDAQLIIGGTNLIDTAAVQTLALSGTIVSGANYRGFSLPVKAGEVYSISRPAIESNRLRYVFTEVAPASGVAFFGGTGNSTTYDNSLKIENIVVPEAAQYLFIYMSNQGETITKLKVERGSKASDWSESPVAVENKLNANASAISTTNSEVSRVDGKTTVNANNISGLTSRMSTVEGQVSTKAEAAALTTLTTRVTNAEGVNTSQGSAITTLQNTVNHATTGLATKASSAALTAVDNKVTAANGRIDTTNSNVTALTGRVSTVEGAVTTKADVSALNSLTTRVTEEERKSTSMAQDVTNLTASVNTLGSDLNNVDTLARLMTSANLVRTDPTFNQGTNGVGGYRTNAANVLSRVPRPSDNPTTSTHEMQVVSTGHGTSTGSFGGFVSSVTARANAVFVVKYIVKMPVGYRMLPASNSVGTGGTNNFVGSTEGTGKYETYFRLIRCGAEGSFSTSGHVYFAGSPVPTESSPVTFHIASIETYDTTDYNDRSAGVASAISTLTSDVSDIEGTLTSQGQSITSLNNSVSTLNADVAKKAEAAALTALTTRVTNAEGVNTSQGTAITNLQNTINHSTTGLATKASTAALTATNSEVTRVDGVVSGHTNQLTQLTSDISAINGTLATKVNATALNDYYTKAQTDAKATEIAAGEVSKYDAGLVIGGANLFANSDFSSGTVGWESTGTGASLTIVADSENKFNQIAKAVSPSVSQGFKSTSAAASAMKLVSGNTYTMSGWVRASAPMTLYPSIDGSGNAEAFPIQVDTSWRYFSVTRKVVSNIIPRIYGSGEYFVANLKLENGSKATDWTPSTSDVQKQLDANATAINTTNSEVSRVDGRVTTEANRITSLTGRVSTVEGAVATKAEAAALTSLTTRVTNAEGVNTSQGSAITTLQNTVNHSTTGLATKASTSALTAVDNKVTAVDGRVTATNSDVTTLAGRVSTVEGAVATKADVSAVNALTTRVGNVEGGLTTQATDITNLTASLAATDKVAKDALPKTGGSGSFKTFKEVLNYHLSTSGTSSNIVIQTPITFSANMFRISGRGYNYASTRSVIDFEVSGYAYTTAGSILQHGARNAGTFPLRIRLGMKDNKLCVILSTKGTNFAYPAFVVDAAVSYGTVPDTFQNGWSATTIAEASLESSGITNIMEPSLLDVRGEIDANASAINTTNAEVSRVDGRVTTEANRITSLTGRVDTVEGAVSTKAEAAALTALTTRVTNAEGVNTSQGSAITTLQNTVNHATTGLDTKASSAALTIVDNKVTAVDGRVNTTNSNVATLTGRVDTVEGAVSTKAEAAALTALTTRVGTVEGGLSTASSNITSLSNSLDASISAIRFVPTQVAIDAAVKTRTDGIIELMDDASTTAPKVIKVKAGSAFNMFAGQHIPINPNTLYKLSYKVKRLSGTGIFYLAMIPLTHNKANGVNNSNSLLSATVISSASYPLSATTTAAPVDVWKEGVYYIKGINPAGATGSGTLASPRIMPNLAAFLRLGAIVPANTEFAIEYFNVEVADVDALDAATSAAITATNSEVSRVNDAVISQGNQLTQLTSSIQTINGTLNTKLDSSAISNYYTKAQADTAADTVATGKIDVFKTSLSASAMDNLVVGGNEAKTKTGGYLVVQYSLSKPVVAGKTYTIRAKVSFNNGGNATANLRFYLGGTTAFHPSGGITTAAEDIIEVSAVAAAGTAQNVSFYCFPNSSANANAVTTVHWVEVFEGSNLTLNEKASAAALTATNSEVGRINGLVTGQAGQLTTIEASVGNVLDTINIKDTRSVNQPPTWYRTNYARRRVTEFKTQTTIGVGGFFGGTYCNLETLVQYGDSSGGPILQTATATNDPSLYVQRYSTGSGVNEVWGAWVQPIKDLRDSISGKADASVVNAISVKVDGMSSHASQLTTLTSELNAAKNQLAIESQVINGIQANYMVKMETNGVLAGFGLIQESGAMGAVTSSFGVNADNFFIGAPSSNKKPFVVTTTSTDINGVTYPAGTWIDTAMIANATIGGAKIADASITAAKIEDLAVDSAKIANGAITTGKIGDLQVDTLKIKDWAVTKPFIYTSTDTSFNGSYTISHSNLVERLTVTASGFSPGALVMVSVNSDLYVTNRESGVNTGVYISGLPRISISLNGTTSTVASPSETEYGYKNGLYISSKAAGVPGTIMYTTYANANGQVIAKLFTRDGENNNKAGTIAWVTHSKTTWMMQEFKK